MLQEFNNHYSSIVEFTSLAVISIDKTGLITSWNPASEMLFGYSLTEIIGKPLSILYPANSKKTEEVNLNKILKGRPVDFYRAERLTKHTTKVFVSIVMSPIKDTQGKVIGASIILRNISSEIQKERKSLDIISQQSYFSAIVDSSDDAIISKNLDGIVTSWNKSAEKIFGYSEDEMIGRSITKIIPKDRMNEEKNILQKISNGEKVEHFHTIRLKKDGSNIDISVSISPIFNQKNQVVGASKIARDISEQVAAEQKLWEYANFDSLTNLPNRRLFMNRLNQTLQKSKRDMSNFCLMYMDLNHFKKVNDELGHQYGDELLIIASKRIKDCFRDSDTVSRLGGDEFAALLPNLYKTKDIHNVISKITSNLIKPISLDEHPVNVSISIGYAVFPINGITTDDLIRYADIAMYKDKFNRRNSLEKEQS